MQHDHGCTEYSSHRHCCSQRPGFALPESRFRELEVPVTEIVPEEFIDRLGGLIAPEALHVLLELLDPAVEAADNPSVLPSERGAVRWSLSKNRVEEKAYRFLSPFPGEKIASHSFLSKHEPGCIPYLIREMFPQIDLPLIEEQILPRWRKPHECKPEGVCTVVVDNINRIRRIPKRFAHLSTLRIPDNSCDIDCRERDFAHKFERRDDHPCHPEEYDISTRNENVSRMKRFKVIGFLRPPHR